MVTQRKEQFLLFDLYEAFDYILKIDRKVIDFQFSYITVNHILGGGKFHV